MDKLAIFSGTSNPQLTQDICSYVGTDLGRSIVSHFPDGETMVKIEQDIRGKDCFVVQSTAPPVNENVMELLIYIDCLKRASANSITIVVPYFGYARQDRKTEGRTPISAKMVADLINVVGANRLVTIDLHAKQIEGFFNIPVDNLKALPVFVDHINANRIADRNSVILAPDVGSMKRVDEYAQNLGCGIAVVHKKRLNGEDALATNLVGEVEGRNVLMFDDMISTAGTIREAASMAKEKGALEVHAFATHGLFTGPAVERIQSSGIDAITTTDTTVTNKRIKTKNEEFFGTHPHKTGWPAFHTVTVAKLLGEAILRIYEKRSVSVLLRSDSDKGIRYL